MRSTSDGFEEEPLDIHSQSRQQLRPLLTLATFQRLPHSQTRRLRRRYSRLATKIAFRSTRNLSPTVTPQMHAEGTALTPLFVGPEGDM